MLEDMVSSLSKLLALLCVLLPAAAQAEGVPPALYRAAQGPELAAQIEIRADGHFDYALAYGALDEHAEGLWTKTDTGIALTTQPKPKPPEFRLDHQGRAGDAPFALLVRWPDGRGIAGVDFRLGLADGSEITGYTQDYGWRLGDPEKGKPVWIELAEPMHGFTSPRFPIAAETHSMTVTLVPNDMGVAAFDGTLFESGGEGAYLLHHPRGDIRFRAISPRS
ncbi:MAG: hypothetical protein LKF30_02055 [Sphingobium sp.]|jgi:hypothetical protein|nr:hypothetical protein [Sphingobium sp.]MCI1270598.1 hypothetical protein [Sphingobium sp.]MCI2052728.1 hypothetical protein [Sphingobium sp.]